jgi:hypothetical protein
VSLLFVRVQYQRGQNLLLDTAGSLELVLAR